MKLTASIKRRRIVLSVTRSVVLGWKDGVKYVVHAPSNTSSVKFLDHDKVYYWGLMNCEYGKFAK